ncbi:ABC transporter ATP-binding protein (plasmid) [Neorhizobium sp. SOG26]|uniref:dipeptide ABC transporter ATP-binding protein n=1 Tax=Neorhizobium sp. SOG26 TaxID=2060726 RepID=UPI000E577FC3|nr:ABC transporter ATP-binding protein [Neorhizobium sp. SOG26]AXV18392.1 ABC transporter ATP-binding protein [Neorhizobium sp. SOG26]
MANRHLSGPILSARNLSVESLGGKERFPVLTDLNFSLEPGKILGLVGESGAGKSMIGRTISQFLPHGFAVTKGTLEFGGEDLVGMAAERRRNLLGREIAFIPQEPLSGLNPVLSVGQQMKEHLLRIGLAPGENWKQRALKEFEAVHLPHGAALLDRYPHQLSGGMCQRILIAMAFASRPRLLIADEPTTALDVTIQARIVKLIAEMQKRDGTAVIFITHDLRLASQISDEIMVLYAGRPAERGPAKQLFSAPAHPYTRCLQLANPTITGPRRGLYILPERMPGLRVLKDLKGCRFASRCPNAVEACTLTEPPLVDIGPNHIAACIRTEKTPEIVPPPLAPGREVTTGTTQLRGEKLTKAYTTAWSPFASRTSFKAVNSVDFTLGEGEFVGIVGESGSGKSSLARLVVGLDTPTDGKLTLAGRDVTANGNADRAYRRDYIQMVFQDPQSALNPRRRIGSIVTQANEATGAYNSQQERMNRASELLKEIGLPPDAAMRFPSQLSGGQKQRVNIARALCTLPKILVADEIVSGLDVSVQAQLLDLLLKLRDEHGFSMLFISHDLSVVRYLCDRVMVMYRGEVVESGRTEAVFSEPQHPYTRSLLAAVPPDDVEKEWSPVLAEAGYQVE